MNQFGTEAEEQKLAEQRALRARQIRKTIIKWTLLLAVLGAGWYFREEIRFRFDNFRAKEARTQAEVKAAKPNREARVLEIKGKAEARNGIVDNILK